MSETVIESDAGPGGPAPTRGRVAVLDLLPAVPAAFVVVGMLALLWPDGAFATRRWTLLAILVLGALALGAPTGGTDRRPRILPAALLWAFATWAALSMIWATSPGLAWENAGRFALYAGAVAVPLVAIPRERDLSRVGALVVGGLGVAVAAALVATLLRGEVAFLAGRLNEPLDYRNGAACLMAMAFWPLICVAAARSLPGVLRITGGALAGGALSLGYLTQSRGTVIALAAAGVVALAMGPERRRRLWLAVAVGAAVAVVSHSLGGPYRAFVDGASDLGPELHSAAIATVGVIIVGAVVGGVSWLLDQAANERTERVAGRVSDVVLVVVVLIAIVGGIAATGNPVDTARDKVDEFKTLEPAATGSRLGTVGGQRYDLWRIALHEFGDHPLDGVGAGNYAFGYYRERKTDRNVNNAHSLPFSLLAETGIVGAVLCLGAIVALLAELVIHGRHVPALGRRLPGALAAAGAAVLGQSLVDWMWLLPALFGLGLFALALAGRLLAERSMAAPARRVGRLPVLLRIGVVVPAVVGVVAVGLLYVADNDVRDARAATTAAGRLDDAKAAAGLDPVSVTPRYLQASAYEDLGRLHAARAALDKALELEPGNFATLGLLGDFELRRGHRRTAHSYYRRALRENPRDVGLQALVRRTG